MILYNTATTSGSNAVTPGYYYNNGSNWVRLLDVNTSGWTLTGNAGTTPGTNFMGTTDNNDVVFKRDNIQSGLLDSTLQNTSWGVQALNPATTGGGNTALGMVALYSNTAGMENTAVGEQALYANTSGIQNTASGFEALGLDTSGSGNTTIGAEGLYANTTGTNNTSDGYLALEHNTTGSNNAGVGHLAGQTNLTGDHITVIGEQADVSADGYTNATAIGNSATVNASNKVRIGNTSVTVIEGQVAYSYPSDARFKNNIRSSSLGLDFIKQLKAVEYNFDTKKFDEYLMQGMADSVKEMRMSNQDYTASSNIVHTGFLA